MSNDLARQRSTSLSILVIDDDDIAREMLCEALRQEGHTVVDLPSPIGATRELFRHNIDAAVLDIVMPGINGDRLARLLRESAKGENLAIVLVSGRSNEELAALPDLGLADAVIPKRDVRKHLAEAVMLAWKRRERTSSVRRGHGL